MNEEFEKLYKSWVLLLRPIFISAVRADGLLFEDGKPFIFNSIVSEPSWVGATVGVAVGLGVEVGIIGVFVGNAGVGVGVFCVVNV